MEEKVYNEMNTEVVSPESNDHEMQVKQGDITHELKTVYRLTEECKSFCYYFRNEWKSKKPRDEKETDNKWQEIKSDLIKRRLREKTNPIIDLETLKKEPVAAIATTETVAAIAKTETVAAVSRKKPIAAIANILRASKLEQYIFSAIAVFLYDNLEGANIDSIYSNSKILFKYVIPADIENVLKKYPESFEEFVPTEAARIHKKRKLV